VIAALLEDSKSICALDLGDDNTGKLAFANLEDLAKRKRRVTKI